MEAVVNGSLTAVPFPIEANLGLAIKLAPPNIHVGLLYRNDDGELRLSHLRWHHVFCGCDEPESDLGWMESSLDDRVTETIAEYLVHVNEKVGKKDISYAIDYLAPYFDSDANPYPGIIGKGLTCATYILAIFDGVKMPLVVEASWPSNRKEDIEYAKQVIAELENPDHRASEEHIKSQRKKLKNVVRFRPEEVAAAFSMYYDHRLLFPEVEKTGEAVAKQVRSA